MAGLQLVATADTRRASCRRITGEGGAHVLYGFMEKMLNGAFSPPSSLRYGSQLYFWPTTLCICRAALSSVCGVFSEQPFISSRWEIAGAQLYTTPLTCSAVTSLTGARRSMMSLPTNNNHPASLLSSLSLGCLATSQLSPSKSFSPSSPCRFVNHLPFFCPSNGSSHHTRPNNLTRSTRFSTVY